MHVASCPIVSGNVRPKRPVARVRLVQHSVGPNLFCVPDPDAQAHRQAASLRGASQCQSFWHSRRRDEVMAEASEPPPRSTSAPPRPQLSTSMCGSRVSSFSGTCAANSFSLGEGRYALIAQVDRITAARLIIILNAGLAIHCDSDVRATSRCGFESLRPATYGLPQRATGPRLPTHITRQLGGRRSREADREFS